MTEIVANRYGKLNEDIIKFGDDVIDVYYVDDAENFQSNKVNVKIKFLFSKKSAFLKKALKVKVQVTDSDRSILEDSLKKSLKSESLSERFDAFKKIQKFSNVDSYKDLKKKSFNTLMQGNVDLTKFISNTDIKGSIEELSISFIDRLIAGEDAIQWKETQNEDSEVRELEDIKNLSVDMINRGQDPFMIYHSLIDNRDFLKTFNGTNEEKKQIDFFNKLPAIQTDFKDDSDDTLVPVYVKNKSDYVEAEFNSTILFSELTVGNLIVYLDLLNGRDEIIQTLKKKVSVNKFLNFLKIPKNAPKLRVQKINRMGSEYFVLKFNHDNKHKILLENVFDVGENFLNKQIVLETTQLIDGVIEIPRTSNQRMFKASYVSDVCNGYNSSRVAVRKQRNNGSLLGFAIAHQLNKDSVQILIRGVGRSAMRASLYRKNLTSKSGAVLVGDSEIASGKCNFVDTNLIDDHVYQYHAIVEYRDCSRSHTRPDIVRFRRFNNSTQLITVDSFINDAEGIKFNVSVSKEKKSADEIVQILRENKIENYFEDKVKQNEISNFENLIHFQVFRVNLDNGTRINLGTMLPSQMFSDTEFSKLKNVSKYNNENCVYEIYPFLVEYNDLFEDQAVFNKSINFYENYSKFYSHYNRRKSLAITKKSMTNKVSQAPLTGLNVIGHPFLFYIDSSGKNLSNVITNVGAEFLKKSLKSEILLNWACSDFKVDYFLIGRTYNGKFDLIGKSNHGSGKNYFIDSTSLKGKLTYSITPVSFDGSMGLKSNIDVLVTSDT